MICQQEQAARCVKANTHARKTRSWDHAGGGGGAEIGRIPEESGNIPPSSESPLRLLVASELSASTLARREVEE